MATNEKKKKAAEEAETTQDAAQVNPATVEQQDAEATADATQKAAQEEPAQAAAQTEVVEIKVSDIDESASIPEKDGNMTLPEVFWGVARSLMRAHGVSVVYRCPKNGYWFINEQYVNEYQLESGNVVDVYRDEVKALDHDA